MSASNDAAAESRQVGHRLADYLDGIEELEVLPDTSPSAFEQLFAEPLPRGEAPLDARARARGEAAAGLHPRRAPRLLWLRHPGGSDADHVGTC
jgi:hypothetical protein